MDHIQAWADQEPALQSTSETLMSGSTEEPTAVPLLEDSVVADSNNEATAPVEESDLPSPETQVLTLVPTLQPSERDHYPTWVRRPVDRFTY